MANDSVVELPTVVQRFRESTEVLEALRERLRALELAEDVQGRAAEALDTTASSMNRTAAAMGEAASNLSTACQHTEVSMGLARQLLEVSDVASLRHEVAAVLQAQNAAASEAATTRELVERILQVDLENAQVDAAAAQSSLRALEAKVAAIPQKYRNKFGL